MLMHAKFVGIQVGAQCERMSSRSMSKVCAAIGPKHPLFISQHPYRMLIRAEFGDTRGSAAVRMSSSPSHIDSAARAMSGDSLDGEQRKGMSCRPNRHVREHA
jgi:hypothetical protein